MDKHWKRCIYFSCIACGESLIGMASLLELEFFVVYIPLKGNSWGFMGRMLKKHSAWQRLIFCLKDDTQMGLSNQNRMLNMRKEMSNQTYLTSASKPQFCHLWRYRDESFSFTAWACKIVSVKKTESRRHGCQKERHFPDDCRVLTY